MWADLTEVPLHGARVFGKVDCEPDGERAGQAHHLFADPRQRQKRTELVFAGHGIDLEKLTRHAQ